MNNMLNYNRNFLVLISFLVVAYPVISIGLAAEPLKKFNNGAGANQPASESIKGEVLVRFAKGADPFRKWDRGMDGLAIARKIFPILSRRRGRIYQYITSDTFSTAELLDIYRSDPQVDSVSPNYARRLHRLPDDPNYRQLWGLQNTGQPVRGVIGTPGADIDAARAWNITSGDSDVVVAVIDSGVFYGHEDLLSNMWQNPDEIPGNKLDDDGNGYIDDIYGYDFAANFSGDNDSNPMDIDTHGSHVAGTIAAIGNNGIGITGVAWHARIMALKAMRPDKYLYDSDLIEAVEYAITMKERGVNIVAINASYGGFGGSQSDPMRDVIAEAGQAGIVFVASAGNDSSDNDQFSQFPSSYNVPNIISVAASDQFDDLADFSNYGLNSVDLAAPGENIYSTVYRKTASVHSEGYNFDAVSFEYTGYTSGITGLVHDCAKGYKNEFPDNQDNYIALIERGSNDENPFHFSDKVRNAMDAGAVAVIIYNDRSGLDNVSLESDENWVPAVFIDQNAGQHLVSLVNPTATVVNILSQYFHLDGTSMAAPHVTGAVALLAAAFPAESVSRRISRILGGSEPRDSLSGLVLTGGRLNLYNSLRLYGNRQVNMAPIYQLLLLE
jgi:subtilisin family serine protease